MRPITFNGTNSFNDDSFNNLCKLLESGEYVELYISCIGCTRATIEGNIYRKKLLEKYGDRLVVHDVSLTDNEQVFAFELIY